MSNKNLFKETFFTLIPLVLTNSLGILKYITNTILVGNFLGGKAISVLSNTFPITLIFYAISIAFSTSISVLISKTFYNTENENNIINSKKIANNGYMFALITGIIVSFIIFIFDNIFLTILNTPNEILYDSRVFLLLFAVSFTPNFLQKNINESLRVLNKPNIPLIFVGINVILNNLLLYLLILNNFGIISIAIANILSDIFILLASYIYIRSHEVLKIDFSLFKIDRKIFKDISNIGIPIVFEQIIVSLIIFFETSISNLGGIICNSAFGIVGRWEEIFFVFSQSIQSLMIIYISRYYFTKDKTMIFRITKNGIILSILPIVLFISIAFIFTDFACKIFLKNEDIISIAVKYFHIAGIAYCIMPIDMIFNGFIIGSAKTKFLLITNIIASISEIIIVILLYKILNYDNMFALGCGIITYTLFTLFLNFIYYLKNVFTLCKIEK